MIYKLYGVDGKEILHHDLQDKGIWCKDGISKENVFVELYGNKLNLKINPEKEKDLYAPDLINIKNNKLGDLKTQNTPFFQAQKRFNIDPQYAVVFNGKDRTRYKNKYPDIEIYFAVDWQIIKFVSGKTIEVKPMVGVWFIPFGKLDMVLNDCPFHSYVQRTQDLKGNAKGSYILNLQDPVFEKVI